MSGRKNVLLPYRLITNGSMGASITSSATNIQYLDNTGIQLNWTGTPNGDFSVQISMDHAQTAQGQITNAGNWVDLTLSPTISAVGSADQAYIDLNQLSAPWIRVVYTRTSGTGTLNCYISAKMV